MQFKSDGLTIPRSYRAGLARRIAVTLAVCGGLLFGSAMLAPTFDLPVLSTALAGATGCSDPPGNPGDTIIDPVTGTILVCEDFSDPRSPTRDYQWGPLNPGAADIVPFDNYAAAGTCSATYTVYVPESASRVTTLEMDFGDGSSPVYQTIPKGKVHLKIALSHVFPMTPGASWTQRATITQTGLYFVSRTTHL